ncbi:tyrosine-protein phosphatase [Sphaerimonospora thailandensis]|uniref:Protein-tyrosine-phosphatase n=1 Tax=Sphaerimonospora thailandensis TaxID=795644 RepID=A0A8J3R967_9ACTN|nr:tyrosine-protein phosphatase [Sphaerimonospora thailandensis]GIH71696.1 protein-tyrosine-phosphatase [Sphaerimonospora thailandensis]
MNEHERWIELNGAVNVRDLGGLPTTDGGVTRSGRIFRSDNLQGLTDGDIDRLVGDLKLRNVVDLRSVAEVRLEGPGPLTRVAEVGIHHLSLFPEGGRFTDAGADTVDERTLPRRVEHAEDEGAEDESAEPQVTRFYTGYLRDRPDSILAALRVLAADDGAAVVHCAAGKDRTGVVSALALAVAGATPEAIVADYVATGMRLEAVLTRLRASETYRADLDKQPADAHHPRAEYMARFLAGLDGRFGGPLGWLTANGWTDDDTQTLRARLRD